MKKMGFAGLFLLVIVLVALSGCSSTASHTQGTAGTDEARRGLAEVDKALDESPEVVVSVDDQKVICRREHVVGSRFPQKICRTVQQMEEERRNSQDKLARDRNYGIDRYMDTKR